MLVSKGALFQVPWLLHVPFMYFLDLSALCLTPVQVWSKSIRGGRFELDLIRQLQHVDGSRGDGANAPAGISCILPLSQVVYTGDEVGRVVSSHFFPPGFFVLHNQPSLFNECSHPKPLKSIR